MLIVAVVQMLLLDCWGSVDFDRHHLASLENHSMVAAGVDFAGLDNWVGQEQSSLG